MSQARTFIDTAGLDLDTLCDDLVEAGKIAGYTKQYGGHHVIVKRSPDIICVNEYTGAYHRYESGYELVDTIKFISQLKSNQNA